MANLAQLDQLFHVLFSQVALGNDAPQGVTLPKWTVL